MIPAAFGTGRGVGSMDHHVRVRHTGRAPLHHRGAGVVHRDDGGEGQGGVHRRARGERRRGEDDRQVSPRGAHRRGRRAQAREALVKKAKDAAGKVHRWGDVVELEPMSAFDRRIIHQALVEDPTIETQSVPVEGTEKKAILLRPKH